MRYQMTQRLLAIGDKGVIYDEFGNLIYQNEGRFFNLTDKVKMLDGLGNVVATLHSRLIEFPKSFYIEIEGQAAAKVTPKPLALLRAAIDIVLVSGERWKLSGTLRNHSFTLEDGQGQTIATASRDWITITDGYGIEIAEGQDDLLVLMVIVALETALGAD
ncbi:LURP-one-related/scramblase family protein [Microbacterium sp. AK031]|uniref:LURP-one-related/scramblase family protein n=1 Tax=Microbacterium sp. AK031 TaxID=2723076 RepID=UPI002167A228|nr:LURP-one-related family protein [Microbacterium sp. AK031]MCS3842080.1 uncharacterized protein YxjI [Microbacterium sp. AK031]